MVFDWHQLLAREEAIGLFVSELPIPGVLSDFVNTVALARLRLQNLRDEVRAISGQKTGDFEFPCHYFLVKVRRLRILERQEAAHHSVEDDTAAPDIALQALVLLACDHLRSSVAGRATCRFEQPLRWLIEITQPKVHNFQRLVEIKEQVFRLQVAMADATLVDVLDARDKLLENANGSLFMQTLVLDDVIEQLAVHAVFHDQVELGFGLDYLGTDR